MLALAIKNLILVCIMLLILHFLIKLYLQDKMMLAIPPVVEVAKTPQVAPVPVATLPAVDTKPTVPVVPEKRMIDFNSTTFQNPNPNVLDPKPDDPKSLDNLFKYIQETTPVSNQPSNSNPLGFDQRMFSNIDPFEDENAAAQYQLWQS